MALFPIGWLRNRWQRAGEAGVGRDVRTLVLVYLLVAAAVLFAHQVSVHYPMRHWLFWRYAVYWIACAYWSLGCVALGHFTVRRLLGRTLPVAEQLATSFAIGCFEFFLAMFLLGWAGFYHPVSFVGLPALMIAVGIRSFYRYACRAFRHHSRRRRHCKPTPLWAYAIVALGSLGVLMVYLAILTPENTQFDARWKHLALAEDYVAHGGIRRFPEGFTVETYPHLVSFLFTWAFLLPFGRLFDHVELAAHMEFTVFVWTLLGIVGLTRLLVRKSHAHLAWTARFLFPGIFLYDSSLSAGADHVAALFAVAIFTLLVRAYADLCPRMCVLLAAALAGGALTKYTAALMLLPVSIAVIMIRALLLARRRKPLPPATRRYWLYGPLSALVAGLVMTAPHWLKNAIWYGDPLYPVLHNHLTPRPWTVDAADLFVWGYQDYQFWRPARTWDGVFKTLAALFNFSFVPNDYGKFHGKVPVFGSLFTLLLVTLPFVRARRRLWGLVGFVHGALFIWYWTHHQDRYLQALVPLMAAVTAACMIELWRAGLFVKLALSVLVALQVIWGGDVYFYSTHSMCRSPLSAVIDLFGAGYRKRYEDRFQVLGEFPKLAPLLPRGARVLLHDNHMHTGIGASSVSDWGGWQFGISYGRLRSPREVLELWRSMGVTHIQWREKMSAGWDSVAGDLVFFHFVTSQLPQVWRVEALRLAPMPREAAGPEAFAGPVAVLGCEGSYATGAYQLEDLTVPVFGPRRRRFPAPRFVPPAGQAGIEELLRPAWAAVVDTACNHELPPSEREQFTLAARRRRVHVPREIKAKPVEIWMRKSRESPPAEQVTSRTSPSPTPPREPRTDDIEWTEDTDLGEEKTLRDDWNETSP